MKPLLPILSLLVLASACSVARPHISPDVSTRDIAVAVRMDSTTGGLLQATLQGPGGDVTLLAPDRLLVVAQNGREWPMVHVAKDRYVTDIEGTTGNLQLRLDRDEDGTAVGFSIPAPFQIEAPKLMSRTVGMTFTWNGQLPTAQVSFEITGSCFAPLGRVLGVDTGTYTINPAELKEAGQLPQSCEGTLTIVRKVTGGSTSLLKSFTSEFSIASTFRFTSTQ